MKFDRIAGLFVCLEKELLHILTLPFLLNDQLGNFTVGKEKYRALLRAILFWDRLGLRLHIPV